MRYARKVGSITEKRKQEFDNFRKNLKIVRCFNGLSGRELGQKIGASKNRINDIEEGRITMPHVGELLDIAKALGTTIDDLLYKEAILTFKSLKEE